MVARAAAGMGAEGDRVAVWVRTRPGCRQTGVRCWGGRMGGGAGARAGLAVAGGAGVRGCVRAGAAVGGVRVGVRGGGGVGGAWNVGGTRSVPKVAPAVFLIVASWAGQIQGMLMPGHIDSHVRWARRAICLLLIFVPSWRSMPSLIRAETRWPAPVWTVLPARRSLCCRKLHIREVKRPGTPLEVVALWAGISQVRSGICMRDLRARLSSRSRL